ncbi:MAG TPA: hypothetical protein VJL84_04680, partial [Kiloniellales bacterium]|nr:hypothetical protein [Kiloniellales bacterium]
RPPFPYVPAPDWPARTAFGECVVVRAAARGRGYQRLLIKARSAAAEAAGRRWLCAGVHLENGHSWRNLLKSGFLMIGCRDEPPPPRLGFLKPLNGSSLPLRPETVRRVACHDIDGHRAAFRAGLIGAGFDGEERVLYRAPVRAAAVAPGGTARAA